MATELQTFFFRPKDLGNGNILPTLWLLVSTCMASECTRNDTDCRESIRYLFCCWCQGHGCVRLYTSRWNPCPKEFANHLSVNTVTAFQAFHLWQRPLRGHTCLLWSNTHSAELILNWYKTWAQPLRSWLGYKTPITGLTLTFPPEVCTLNCISHWSNIPPQSSL